MQTEVRNGRVVKVREKDKVREKVRRMINQRHLKDQK